MSRTFRRTRKNAAQQHMGTFGEFKGYWWMQQTADRPNNPWQGRVGMKGEKRRYASFASPEEAEEWAKKTRAEMHGEFADKVPARKGKE